MNKFEMMLGYSTNREMKKKILQEMKTEGKSLQEICARYSMPHSVLLDDEGKFEYNGTRITPAEWYKLNPLGEFGKLVTIATRKQRERWRNESITKKLV
jgi:hypothetical protein